jgi:hypothetical protein
VENFTAKDISTIIKACKDSGVRSLDCGGLKLSFEPEEREIAPMAGAHQEELIVGPQESMPERELSSEDEEELNELELQNLMISDPVGYENLMRHGTD